MKKKALSILIFLVVFQVQSQKTVPSIDLKSLTGELVNTSEISTSNVLVFNFWATWCVPCINELDAINEVYEDWKDETQVELIAISVDNSRTTSRVRSLVNGKGWDYRILLDTNQDFMRAVNAPAVPFLIVVKDGEIKYSHTGYTPGSEIELYEKIKELSK